MLEINPSSAEIYCEFWTYQGWKVEDLHFDPKEWMWKKQGAMEETHFFDYKTRRGYKIIIQSSSTRLKFDEYLESMGFSGQQRKLFFLRLWHPWMPKKISTMIWLTIAEGIPVGAWRRRIGQSGECNLCVGGMLQTARHAFFDCARVKIIWDKIRELMSPIHSAPKIGTWEQALYGDLGHPRIVNTAEDILWESGSHCMISDRTLWDVFRMSTIWYLWCQHV